MSRRKNKPSSPEEIAARRRERLERIAGADAEAARLTGQGAEVNRDTNTGEIVGAFKPDVVTMMARADAISAAEESAVRRFERLILKAGTTPSCLSSLERVNGQSAGDPTLASVIRHVEAAQGLEELRRHMDALTWGLLRELCDGNLILTRWRQVVERHTRERNDKVQGGVVRQAFRVLVAAEEAAIEARKRRPANDAQADAIALAG